VIRLSKDLVAGWALWRLFRPMGSLLPALTGVLRVIYGVAFLVAIAFLAQATVRAHSLMRLPEMASRGDRLAAGSGCLPRRWLGAPLLD
jgi:hypothetical protein